MNKCSILQHTTICLGDNKFPTVVYNSNTYSREPRGNQGKRTQTSLTLEQNARKIATI